MSWLKLVAVVFPDRSFYRLRVFESKRDDRHIMMEMFNGDVPAG